MPIKQPCIYTLASKKKWYSIRWGNRNLPARVLQHKHEVVEGFSQRYGIHNSVWYEVHTALTVETHFNCTPGVPEQSCDLAKWSRDQSEIELQAARIKGYGLTEVSYSTSGGRIANGGRHLQARRQISRFPFPKTSFSNLGTSSQFSTPCRLGTW